MPDDARKPKLPEELKTALLDAAQIIFDFNPNHDPHTGEFSSSGGGGSSAVLRRGYRPPGYKKDTKPGGVDYEFEGDRKSGPSANDIKHANALPTDTVMEDYVKRFGRAALKKLKDSKDAVGCTVDGVQHDQGCDACDTGDNADCTCGAMDAADPPHAKDSIPLTIYEPAQIVMDGEYAPRKTPEGYMIAFSRVARSGIQIYKGKELGVADKEELRVYRPSNEVFSRKSMHSYSGRPITNNHPPQMVDSTNWRKFAIGEIGEDVVRDGEFVRVPMILRDAAAIKDYEGGKAELSLGYTMDLKLEEGRTPHGEIYDAVQTQIRANHLALVNTARGGPALRIGDEGDDAMTKQLTVDGLTISLEPRDAEIVMRHLDDQKKIFDQQQKALDEANVAIKLRDEQISNIKKDSDTKDAKIATLEKQLKDSARTPEQTAAELQAIVMATDQAKKLLGDKFTPAYDIEAIRRQVVDAKMGAAAKNWTADQVRASFESLVALGPTGAPRNAMDRALSDGISVHSSQDARDVAYEKMVNDARNAWKTPQRA